MAVLATRRSCRQSDGKQEGGVARSHLGRLLNASATVRTASNSLALAKRGRRHKVSAKLCYLLSRPYAPHISTVAAFSLDGYSSRKVSYTFSPCFKGSSKTGNVRPMSITIKSCKRARLNGHYKSAQHKSINIFKLALFFAKFPVEKQYTCRYK